MMTSFPGSPQVQKGRIIAIDPITRRPSVIVFQYNPDTLTRTLTVQSVGAERGEALRLTGPPQESITVDVEIDAADQLEFADPIARTIGIHSALASLEMLIYPSSARMLANEALAAAGILEIIPPEAPLTLFAWSEKRIVPVRITTFTITEEAFDTALNPIRAKVSLGLRVLSYSDLGLPSPGGALFMSHHQGKEILAKIGAGPSASFSVKIGG